MLFREGFLYIAGYDNPALVPNSSIENAIAERGFQVVLHTPCDEYTAPFAYPQHAGPCDDEWDYIAAILRTGPDQNFDIPERVAFIITIPPAQPPPPELPPQTQPGQPPAVIPPPPPTQPALVHQREKKDRRRDLHVISEALGLAVVAPVMWYASREVQAPVLRTGLKAAAVGTAAVNAYLLWTYLSR